MVVLVMASFVCCYRRFGYFRVSRAGPQGRWIAGDLDASAGVFHSFSIDFKQPQFTCGMALNHQVSIVGSEGHPFRDGAHRDLLHAFETWPAPGEKFQRARKRVRDALAEDGIAGEIEKLVEKLLGPV